jgi:hypothetical protein
MFESHNASRRVVTVWKWKNAGRCGSRFVDRLPREKNDQGDQKRGGNFHACMMTCADQLILAF